MSRPASTARAASQPDGARRLQRRISRNGGIRWKNHWVNVSHVLADEYIAFDEINDGLWDVHFGALHLGRFHESLLRIEDANGDLARTRRRSSPVLPHP